MLRVPYQELYETLRSVLSNLGFSEDRASACAQLFAETSRDGVYSHGLNRFPRFVSAIEKGLVKIHERPVLVDTYGAWERWNGNQGPGNLNAKHCMNRAIELARKNGLGCVALANTNHWMRAGSYGWQAAEAGAIGMCWTNTLPNLPPWGAADARVGNNPLVIAVPRATGHVVLDTAMSQFSYGALASYRMRGELLPVEGGFDSSGNLTRDPGAIEKSGRPLPIGYWKGSGMSLLLDLVAAVLSGGLATYQMPPEPEKETGMSQVFIAFDVSRLGHGVVDRVADEVIAHFRQPVGRAGQEVRYPGERVLQTRKENLEKGIPVEPAIWERVKKMQPA